MFARDELYFGGSCANSLSSIPTRVGWKEKKIARYQSSEKPIERATATIDNG
jgi:hypothetical protein